MTPGVQPPAGMTVAALTVDDERSVYYVGQSSDPGFGRQSTNERKAEPVVGLPHAGRSPPGGR